LLERGVFIPRLGRLLASEALLSAFDVDHIATEALLFQTGYLTFDEVRQRGALIEYRLRWPNLEVQASLTGALLESLAPVPHDPALRPSGLYDLLLANDFDSSGDAPHFVHGEGLHRILGRGEVVLQVLRIDVRLPEFAGRPSLIGQEMCRAVVVLVELVLQPASQPASARVAGINFCNSAFARSI
jgi:hypothetical protein